MTRLTSLSSHTCAAGGVTYLHGDHLGSVGKTSGDTATAQLYDAYGAKRGASEVATPYRYTGQRWEENDALDIYYYKARWYDPALGRFLQPDTIVPEPGNPQNLNRYSYCLGNPLRYVDPSGLFTEDELLGFGFSQEQVDAWKQDTAWWAMLFNAQLLDTVIGARRFTGGVGPIGGFFGVLTKEYAGTGPSLWIAGYGGLEDYRQQSKGWQLWRLSGGEFSQVQYATIGAAPPAASWEAAHLVGYRNVLKYDPSAVDWTDVGLDVIGLVPFARSLVAAKEMKQYLDLLGTVIGGIQAGKAGAQILSGSGDTVDCAQFALAVVGTVPNPVQPFANLASLGLDLGLGIRPSQEEVWQ